MLAQLRTGMTRLNGFLSRIGAAESDHCARGHASGTVEHFLLRCIRGTALREYILQYTTTRRGSLSFYLGRKAPPDSKQWSPDMRAVRAEIKYAMAMGRLDPDDEQDRASRSERSLTNTTQPQPAGPALAAEENCRGLYETKAKDDPNVASVPRRFRPSASGRNKFHPSNGYSQCAGPPLLAGALL